MTFFFDILMFWYLMMVLDVGAGVFMEVCLMESVGCDI